MTTARHGGALSSHARDVERALLALDDWGWARGWRGSDPYDGLNTTRLLTPLKDHRRGRQLLMQLVKRAPVDLRPVLGIEPDADSAALAWLVSAYSQVEFREPKLQQQRLQAVVDRLLGLRLPAWKDPCWGYHYDMQSRVFFYRRSDPNAIATAYAGAALLDLYGRSEDPRLLELAEGVARFIVTHVPQTDDPPGAYFGYLVGDRSPIHNANMLICALLARVGEATGERRWQKQTERGLEWTLARQRRDGSWPYGERPNLAWVDGFHSGYVLDALRVCADAGLGTETEDAWRRGLAFYRERLFLADGTPRYFSHHTYPIDLQCVAQALETFSVAAAHDRSYLEPARRVFEFSQRSMRRADGAYVFQRRRLWVNRAPHIRGGNADMMLGLARLLRAELAA